MCLRQAFKRRKQVSLVELSTKNLQNLSVRAKGYVASKKEKNELSLTCTSSRCLLPQLSLFFVKCCHTRSVCTQSRRKSCCGFAMFGRAPSAPGDLGGLRVRAVISALVGHVDLGGC